MGRQIGGRTRQRFAFFTLVRIRVSAIGKDLRIWELGIESVLTRVTRTNYELGMRKDNLNQILFGLI